ncbi:hypothetical protein B0H14DRAFT_2560635 [Mycena olivaceomarginata]|nr:hypothetical protein B0H14DRAFT_2560635 [Mycena olivaceomarginata]
MDPVHLFCAHFLGQVPLIHAPTWNMEDTLPILARVFTPAAPSSPKHPKVRCSRRRHLSQLLLIFMAGLGKAVTLLQQPGRGEHRTGVLIPGHWSESAWIEWAEVETIKSSKAYFVFGRPAEMEMEIELLPLPCDDTLWCTQSAAEWSTACVQDALAARAVPPDTDPTEAVLLPPFGLFILIRAIFETSSLHAHRWEVGHIAPTRSQEPALLDSGNSRCL